MQIRNHLICVIFFRSPRSLRSFMVARQLFGT